MTGASHRQNPAAPSREETSDPKELLDRLGVQARVDPEPLAHNAWLTPGIWKVHTPDGAALLKHLSAHRPSGQTAWEVHWSAGGDDQGRWNYWAREALVYRDRLFEAYAGSGLGAPEPLAVEVGDADAVLLLSWEAGHPGEDWEPADYAPAARALGRAQGPYLVNRALPELGWLSRGFLRDYSREKPVEWWVLEDDDAWAHPLAREAFPPDLRDRLRFVHDNRERLYQINEALPRTLCHLDFWTKNLIAAPGGDTVVLDWAFFGLGALGEDIGNLIPDAVFDLFLPARSLSFLETAVFDAYEAGLRESGWDDDARLVRLGMWSSAVKYDWLGPATVIGAQATEHLRYGGVERVDPVHKLSERAAGLLHLAAWAEKALGLAEELGL